MKELILWKKAGITPAGKKWYQETGLGMGATMGIVSEKRAYTLTDRSTYLFLKHTVTPVILNEGDESLKNIYHVIEAHPDTFPSVNARGARLFSDFVSIGSSSGNHPGIRQGKVGYSRSISPTRLK